MTSTPGKLDWHYYVLVCRGQLIMATWSSGDVALTVLWVLTVMATLSPGVVITLTVLWVHTVVLEVLFSFRL